MGTAWAGGASSPMRTLTSHESERYERQIRLPCVGPQGQARLKRATVFISGLGGLGSVSSYLLAAAGVGCLRVVDRDRVELSNLNRQILHWTPDIGRRKTVSAAEKLGAFNPSCRIEAFDTEVQEENAAVLVGDAAVIVDGSDNVKTRKVLNRVSVEKKIPFVYGGVEGFNGMVSTLVPGRSACFECLFGRFEDRSQPPAVLGALPSLVASIQALEVIKWILGIGEGLVSRLLIIRGAEMTFRTVRTEADPECAVCGSTGSRNRADQGQGE